MYVRICMDETEFHRRVSKTLDHLKSILDNTRHPRLAGEVEHRYDDKYALAEFLANTAVAAEMNAFERFGLDSEKLLTLCRWVHDEKKTIKLRFEASSSCVFFKERDVEVRGPEIISTETTSTETHEHTTRTSFFGGGMSNKESVRKHRVVMRVKEQHWKVSYQYSIKIVGGTGSERVLELQSRSSSGIIMTSGSQSDPSVSTGHQHSRPLPENTRYDPIETDLTWFVKMIDPREQMCQFTIDRSPGSCKTPRRNDDIESALQFHQDLIHWAMGIDDFFQTSFERVIEDGHTPVNHDPGASTFESSLLEPGTRGILVDLEQEPSFNGKQVIVLERMNDTKKYKVQPASPSSGLPPLLLVKPQNIVVETPFGPSLDAARSLVAFVPIVPVLENGSVLGMTEVGNLLTEQSRSLDECIDVLSKTYPPRQLVKLRSIAEASIVFLCNHLQQLASLLKRSIDYIEDLLREQLLRAIGKDSISAVDLDQFMAFHNRRFFQPDSVPKPFIYSVRRQNHDPDGTVAIEMTRRENEPVSTFVRHIPGGDKAPSFYMPIDAATSIELTGECYLHGWMKHDFMGEDSPTFRIAARARQFSSFLLVVGTMVGSTQFKPKQAIIISNKDEVLIPLLTKTLPTAEEFKDAVTSLSPEQKSFAESFRSMQLASSMFGLCIIQLKPQLEAVLGLPCGSLTKEIQLTQDILTLFVEYQIPSDLMSFDGVEEADQDTKLETVKRHVKTIMTVIDAEKEKQLKDQMRKTDMEEEMAIAFANTSAEQWDNAALARKSDLLSSQASMAPRGLPRRRGGAAPPQSAPLRKFSSSAFAYASSVAQVAPEQRRVFSFAFAEPDGKPPKESHMVRFNFTAIPTKLDEMIERVDRSNALRTTIIDTDKEWKRNRQENLLTKMKSSNLKSSLDDEKKKAFDLLDALTRSGALPIDCSELHIIVGVTHSFENNLIGTLLCDNINPITKLKQSMLVLSSVTFDLPCNLLVQDPDQIESLLRANPQLIGTSSPDEEDSSARNLTNE